MLRLPRFRLLEPRSYGEAAQLLAENGAGALDRAQGTPTLRVMLVAGGTDLFPNMKRRQFTPEVLISLARVREPQASTERHLDISAGRLCGMHRSGHPSAAGAPGRGARSSRISDTWDDRLNSARHTLNLYDHSLSGALRGFFMKPTGSLSRDGPTRVAWPWRAPNRPRSSCSARSCT